MCKDITKEELKFINKNGKRYVQDIVRKKYLVLTPEEWVRQHLLLYLINEKKYPKNLIQIEKKLEGKDQFFRPDIVIYDNIGKARMIIECKAENIKISQEVFEQISKYNSKYKADYLLVSNGKQNIVSKMDYIQKKYTFLREIPDYAEVVGKD